jgi:hypothetical protein
VMVYANNCCYVKFTDVDIPFNDIAFYGSLANEDAVSIH